MDITLTLVRAGQYAALLSLAGSLAFLAFIAEPALRRRLDGAGAAALRARLYSLMWESLALGLVTGALWLVLEARSVSGLSFAEVCTLGIIEIVQAREHFGAIWQLRGLVAIPLALALLLADGQRQSLLARAGFWAALALAAAELAMIAGAGHAMEGEGWTADLHLLGDATHLLAAGAWIGGRLPLAFLFAAARRDGGTAWAAAARDATFRFSLLGIVAVGTLIATGFINSIFLVGSIPALLGTPYGHLLLLKLALFLTMVTFAAINRQWLAPQLVEAPAETPHVLRQLQRNALIEAGLGGAVLLVVGTLGTTAPALHVQPEWPLPFTLSLETLEADRAARLQAIAAGVVALGGLALLLWGVLKPRRRMLQMLLGLFVFLAVGWWPLQFMVATAYPTSFYRSAVPFTAASVTAGAQVFAANCAACHGADGKGDGPLAHSLPVRPADLTAAHIFGHSDGDLFWWISHGIEAGGMPGFAAVLRDSQRWDVINFVHARAAALQPQALLPEVTRAPAPLAPDFAFEQAGRQNTLRQALTKTPVLLVLYRLPEALAPLQALAAAEAPLRAEGLRLLALPIESGAPDGEAGAMPDFAATSDAAMATAYKLFEGGDPGAVCAFLVDRAGYLRARWTGAAAPPTPVLLVQLDRLARMPLAAQPAHVHAH
ncbi:MAG TPA: copper homeostasis membrane protein CopD [Stellaceae bacterium]|nr:copper homeostasis membrane protein CopD [Stellaceae bacterium]